MRRFIVLVIIMCMALCAFAGCSQSPVKAQVSAQSNSSAARPSETGSASNTTTAPATVTQSATAAETSIPSDSIEIKGVSFNAEADQYFGGDAKLSINKLAPLLNSAAQAAMSMKKPIRSDESPDVSVEWGMVYQYLNTYGDENPNIKQLESGDLKVTTAEMKTVFASMFSFFKGTVPELKTDYAITFDQKSGAYIIGRSDFGEISFAVTAVQLSKAADTAAIITITAYDSDGKTGGNILVEIVPKAGTYYGYSVNSITLG